MFGGIATTLVALIALIAMAAGAGASFLQNDDVPTPMPVAEATDDDGVTPEVTKGPQQVPPTPVRIVADEEAETGGATSTGPFILVDDSIFEVTSVCLTNVFEGAQNMVIEGLRLDSATVRMTLRFDGGFRGADLSVNQRGPDGATMTTSETISPDSFSLADGRGSGITSGRPVAFDTVGASISTCASAPAADTDTTGADTDMPETDMGDAEMPDAEMPDVDMGGDLPEADELPESDDMVDADEAATDETGTDATTPDVADAADDAADAPSAIGSRMRADGAWLTVLGSDPLPLTATCLDLTPSGAYALRASVAVTSPIDAISLEPTTGGMFLVVRNAQGVVTHLAGPTATQVVTADGLSEVAAIAQSMSDITVSVPLQVMMTNAPLHPCGDLGIEFGAPSDASGIGSAYVAVSGEPRATFMAVIGACKATFPGGDALAVRLTTFDDAEASTAFGYGRSAGIRDSTLVIGDRTFGHGPDDSLTEIAAPDGMLVLAGTLVDPEIDEADQVAGDQVMVSIVLNESLIGACPTAER